jgi:ribosomal-protein-alanine N-acetyltransferase
MALNPCINISGEEEKKNINKAIKSNRESYLIIIEKKNNSPIGYIRINWLDKSYHFGWLRFALGEERGKGYSKDALQCLLIYLFKKGMHRIDAEVYEFNKISLSLLTNLGFKKEGIKRKAHFDGKNYHDIVILGLLKEDFKG